MTDSFDALHDACRIFYKHERERLESVGIDWETFEADWLEHNERFPLVTTERAPRRRWWQRLGVVFGSNGRAD